MITVHACVGIKKNEDPWSQSLSSSQFSNIKCTKAVIHATARIIKPLPKVELIQLLGNIPNSNLPEIRAVGSITNGEKIPFRDQMIMKTQTPPIELFKHSICMET
jgi:hypothetical protein